MQHLSRKINVQSHWQIYVLDETGCYLNSHIKITKLGQTLTVIKWCIICLTQTAENTEHKIWLICCLISTEDDLWSEQDFPVTH